VATDDLSSGRSGHSWRLLAKHKIFVTLRGGVANLFEPNKPAIVRLFCLEGDKDPAKSLLSGVDPEDSNLEFESHGRFLDAPHFIHSNLRGAWRVPICVAGNRWF
jgi:hypothetical protein